MNINNNCTTATVVVMSFLNLEFRLSIVLSMNVLPNYRVGIVGGLGVEPPQFMSTDAHF